MLVKLLASRVQKGEHLHHHLGGDHHQGSFYPEDPVFSSGNQFKKQMQPGLIGRIMPSWVKPTLCKWPIWVMPILDQSGRLMNLTGGLWGSRLKPWP